jgi:hypothetical protein
VREVDGVARARPERPGSPIAFHKPIRRAYRLSTADGRTSFHFSQKVVVHSAGGLKIGNIQVQPGAASEHCRYIEREGAVAAVAVPEIAATDNPVVAQINADRAARYQENDDELGAYSGHYLAGNSTMPFSRLRAARFASPGIMEAEALEWLKPSSELWRGAPPMHDSVVVQETSRPAADFVAWDNRTLHPFQVRTPGRYQRAIDGKHWWFRAVKGDAPPDFDTSAFAALVAGIHHVSTSESQ